MTLLRLSILLAIASSHAFPIPPSFVGQRSSSARLSLGKGILEMAEVDASTVFPAQTDGDESFLGNYEDLVMPGQEGHGYKLILKDDDERFRLHIKQQQQSDWNSEAAQQRARANMGYFANRDLAGNVPETNGVTSTPQMRQNMDYFSSHAVGTTIPDRTALDVSSQAQWQEHMDFFSTPSSSSFAIPNDIPTDATEARARARANIDFFSTLKDIGQTFNKMDEARKVARNNIDFFSDTAKSRSEKKAKDDSKERTTARLNIGYFS